MQYKKETLTNWKKRLAELRTDSKRPFGAKLEESRVSFDLSVLQKNRAVNIRDKAERY